MDQDQPQNGSNQHGEIPQHPWTEEDDGIKKRRQAVGKDEDSPLAGLALSGGGIRSATFCLGLIRALAANGVLHRFDYVSTVSGGGYIGAALGRLFQKGSQPSKIEEGLANEHSILLWWLRNNGRYLIPHGLADKIEVWASHFRAFLATHADVAMCSLFIAAVMVLPHLLFLRFVPATASAMMSAAYSIFWLLVPATVFWAFSAINGYWASREPETRTGLRRFGFALVHCLAFALSYQITRMTLADETLDGRVTLYAVVAGVSAFQCSMVVGWIWQWRLATIAADKRIYFTRQLSWALYTTVLIFLLGLLDLASWHLSFFLVNKSQGVVELLAPPSSLLAILVACRTCLAGLTVRNAGAANPKYPWLRLIDALGLLTLGGVIFFWMVVFQALVFFLFQDLKSFEGQNPIIAQHINEPYVHWSIIVLFVGTYILYHWRRLEQLNWSSMHPFYRSRLARTYVSVGNFPCDSSAKSETRFPTWPLDEKSREIIKNIAKLTTQKAGDDLLLEQYRPHEHGGPIHLINCCINQTRDDRTGNYNADRKGICLTVSSFGVEVGAAAPTRETSWAIFKNFSLAQWTAISGAAVGSGLGSRTMTGLSALLFLSAFRLGYWCRWDGTRSVNKFKAVFSELFARFPGLQSAQGYLSDGGHFENTGVYALIKRELPLIVLADCGADPAFVFEDVENMVRKARIDYSAEIDFIDPATLEKKVSASTDLLPYFGLPDDIGPGISGDAFMLLARITYKSKKTGALLIVKPRRIEHLPLDVAGYADRHARFPQEPTADQFFDEAQWESYEKLGYVLGRRINKNLVDELPVWARVGRAVGAGELSVRRTSPDQPPTSIRQRILAAAGTSLGIGATVSVLLAGWQAWDHEMTELRNAKEKTITEANARMKNVSAALQRPDFNIDEVADDLNAILSFHRNEGDTARKAVFKNTMISLAEKLGKKCEDKREDEAQQDVKKKTASCRGYVYDLQKPEEPIPSEAMIRYWKTSAPMKEPENAKACLQDPEKPFTLKIQFYGEVDRPIANKAFSIAKKAGVAVLEIENSLAAAKKLGLERPSYLPVYPYSWFVESDLAEKCAIQLIDLMTKEDTKTSNDKEHTPHRVYLLPGSQRAVSNGLRLLIAKEAK